MRLKQLIALPALLSVALLTACGDNKDSAADSTTPKKAVAEQPAETTVGDALATVNGKAITEQQFRSFMMETGSGANIDRETAVNELIARELIHQDALKNGLDQRIDVRQRLEAVMHEMLVRVAIREILVKDPVTDEEMQKEYDDFAAQQRGKEYKARHILVEDEAGAKELIVSLDGGADFAELARTHSTGPTGKNGGDLGWFDATQMVPPFAEALKSLEKGNYSKSPVQTQFGWHVILLEDTREMEPPAMESIEPQLRQIVQQKHIGAYLDKLKTGADIKIMEISAAE